MVQEHNGSLITTLQQQVDRLLETVRPAEGNSSACDGCDELFPSTSLTWYSRDLVNLCAECLRETRELAAENRNPHSDFVAQELRSMPKFD